MKKIFYILFCLLLCAHFSEVQAQTKAEIKLEQLYQKKPKKCISKANKLVKKRQERTVAYYYLALSYHKLYKEDDKTSSLSKSIRYLKSHKRYAAKSDFTPDQQKIAEIRESIEGVAEGKYDIKKYRTALKYSKYVITLFGDTMALHADIERGIAASAYNSKGTPTPKTKTTKKPSRSPLNINPAQLISDASSLIGTRYKYGGESKSGMDCSGFNVYVYRKSGVNLPHSARMQSAMGVTISKKQSKPGDLIFFGSNKGGRLKIQHTGMIYSNDDGKIKIVHCPNSGVGIEGEGDTSYDMYWEKRFLFIKRISNDDLLTIKTN